MKSTFLALALTALFVTAVCAQDETQPSVSDSVQGTVASAIASDQAMPLESAPMMMGSNCGCAGYGPSYAAPIAVYGNQPGMIGQVVYQQPIVQQPNQQTYMQPNYTQGYPQPQFASSPCGCGQSYQGQQVSNMINTPTTTVSTPIYSQDSVDQNFTQPVSQPCCDNTTTNWSDPCCQTRTRGFGSRIFRRYR